MSGVGELIHRAWSLCDDMSLIREWISMGGSDGQGLCDVTCPYICMRCEDMIVTTAGDAVL